MTDDYVDLVLDNGELMRIECPAKHADEVLDTVNNQMRMQGLFCAGMLEGCRIEYLGHRIDKVNMVRVVGVLS